MTEGSRKKSTECTEYLFYLYLALMRLYSSGFRVDDRKYKHPELNYNQFLSLLSFIKYSTWYGVKKVASFIID